MTVPISVLEDAVEDNIREALLTLSSNIQDAAIVAMELTEQPQHLRILSRRVFAALMLSGINDAHNRILPDLSKIAAGFEIQWMLDKLRRSSWCGIEGKIHIPVAVTFASNKVRVLGNVLQALSRSLIMNSSEQTDYLLHVLKQLDEGALLLSESRSLFEAIDTSPNAESVLNILKKRAGLFRCAILANKVLFETTPDDATLIWGKKFGDSFGLAYQLWVQLRFASEVYQGDYWTTNEDLIKRDYLHTYPVAYSLHYRANKGLKISSENHQPKVLQNLDITKGMKHAHNLLLDSAEKAKIALDKANLPTRLASSWTNLTEQLLVA